MNGLETLRTRYPWPLSPPDRHEDWFGWFCSDTAEMLERNLGVDTRLVVELGSFLGFSSRAILQYAPNAHLLCVDTWKGSPEHLTPNAPPEWTSRITSLYEGFLRNLWPWRTRLTPIRQDSLVGLAEIEAAGLVPDLVYVDSEHTVNRVSRELAFITRAWPTAIIVGDDYNNAAVAFAADDHARESGRTMLANAASFCFPGVA
jgi:hypothetical protein